MSPARVSPSFSVIPFADGADREGHMFSAEEDFSDPR
jgi:hypothetical protein